MQLIYLWMTSPSKMLVTRWSVDLLVLISLINLTELARGGDGNKQQGHFRGSSTFRDNHERVLNRRRRLVKIVTTLETILNWSEFLGQKLTSYQFIIARFALPAGGIDGITLRTTFKLTVPFEFLAASSKVEVSIPFTYDFDSGEWVHHTF